MQNIIINVDNTVLDINDKYKEIKKYITSNYKGILKSIDKDVDKAEEVKNVSNIFDNFYNMYDKIKSKSIETYNLTVMSTLAYMMGINEQDISEDAFIKSISSDKNSFIKTLYKSNIIENLLRSNYKYVDDGKYLMRLISQYTGKIIFLGNSVDQLDNYKADFITNNLDRFIFNNIYNIETLTNIDLDIIISESSIKPENTGMITSDICQAYIGSQRLETVYFINNEDSTKQKQFINKDKTDFITVSNTNELLKNLLDGDGGL